MRHQKNTRKLGRTSQHRDAMLANLVVSLIQHKRVKTTLAKAKAARPLAEKLVTLGKGGTLHDRRLAVAKIGQIDMVSKLFKEIAPSFKDRKGWLHPHHQARAAPIGFRAGRFPRMGRLRRRQRGKPRQPPRHRPSRKLPPRPKRRPRRRRSPTTNNRPRAVNKRAIPRRIALFAAQIYRFGLPTSAAYLPTGWPSA